MSRAEGPPPWPTLAALASLISLQVGAAFAKTLFPLVGPDGVAALRLGLAGVILLVIFRPWERAITAHQGRALLIYGVMVAAMNVLIYRAFAHIPVGIAISLEVLGPLAVAMLGSRRRADLIWVGLALIGVTLLPFGQAGAGLDARGIAFALAAAACWGLYIVVGKNVAEQGGRGVAIGMSLAVVIVVPMGLVQAGPALFDWNVLALGVVIALLSSALPFLLDMVAMRKLPRQVFGVLMSASPAVSALAGLIILHERLSWSQWGGVAAIMVACAGAALGSRSKASVA